MTRQILIASAVALALSVTACGREDRADATRTAPGANTATSPASAIPPAADQSTASSPTGGTSGMGAAGTTGAPDASAKGADSTTGMGTNPQVDTAAQPYGSQSSVPPTGAPSSGAGDTAR